jgi:hypothetical protein
MSDQNQNYAIGDPVPVQSAQECGALGQIVTFIAAPIIGVVVVAHLCMPARARGASYSAKLKWQQRQAEVNCAVAAQSDVKTTASCADDASVAPGE